MSLVSWNHHYIRDGQGREQLYDLIKDPSERANLAESGDRKPVVAAFRTMLLDVLTESPGSTEVERAYLQSYRRALESVVREGIAGRVAIDPRSDTDRVGPSRRPAS